MKVEVEGGTGVDLLGGEFGGESSNPARRVRPGRTGDPGGESSKPGTDFEVDNASAKLPRPKSSLAAATVAVGFDD